MPQPSWTHTCTKTGRTRYDRRPFRCWRCFGHAEFAGWTSSVVEMMAGYQRLHGLKCIGPHRRLADELFLGAFKPCEACGGSGVGDDDAAHLSWSVCAGCGGLGRRPAVSEEDVERRRALVLEVFPDAARPRGRCPVRGAGGQLSEAGRYASANALGASPAASEPPKPLQDRRVVGTGSPDGPGLFMATLYALVLAPGWLFASIWGYRNGKAYTGTVLLFASAFAALSGLMAASPSSFDRRWLWVWGAFGVGLFVLLGFGAVQAACAGWSAAAE